MATKGLRERAFVVCIGARFFARLERVSAVRIGHRIIELAKGTAQHKP